jgi:hypothetical protein
MELLVQLVLELGLVVLILRKKRLAVAVAFAATKARGERHDEVGALW